MPVCTIWTTGLCSAPSCVEASRTANLPSRMPDSVPQFARFGLASSNAQHTYACLGNRYAVMAVTDWCGSVP